MIDNKTYGELFTKEENPDKALQEWLHRIPTMINVKMQRIIDEHKDNIKASKVKL
jgi:hypothetical protein